jgi:hypothetical protein
MAILTRINDLMEKWLKSSYTSEGVIDIIVQEQFVNFSWKKVKVWVKKGNQLQVSKQDSGRL